MVLESTVLCLDTSYWMKNGDYTPSRFEAQNDAVGIIANAKLDSNQENLVGVMAAAGKNPQVLVTLSNDIGQILGCLHGLKLTGNLNFSTSLQVAQLILKHRQNKNQAQRVIFFVGSPIEEDSESLVNLAKKLKKNGVAVDIVNFGEADLNREKLEAFVAAINNQDNSHLVNIPPGPFVLSDVLVTSPILSSDNAFAAIPTAATGATGGSAATGEFGGIDPNLDPELAMAIKMSMEEERARLGKETSESKPATSVPQPMEEEDAELMKALQMSMQPVETSTSQQQPSTQQPQQTTTTQPQSTSQSDVQPMEEDDELKLALQMSMQQPAETKPAESDVKSKIIEDPEFLKSVLMGLPGVDPNSEVVKNLLDPKKEEEKKKDQEKKDPK